MGLENYKVYLYRFRRPLFILGLISIIFISFKVYSYLINRSPQVSTINEIIEVSSSPKVINSEKLNFLVEEKDYSLVFDEKNKVYRLIENSRPDKTLSIFPNAIDDNFIAGDSSYLIVQGEGKTYFVNVQKRRNTLLPDFSLGPVNISISPKGNYILYTAPNSPTYQLHNTISNQQLPYNKNSTLLSWTSEEDLIALTFQQVQDISSELLQEESTFETVFQRYSISNQQAITIYRTEDFKFKPTALKAIGSGEVIYFEIGDQAYRLILDQIN